MLDRISPISAAILGMFVVVAAGLGIVGVFAVGEHNYWGVSDTVSLRAEFQQIAGIEAGSRVRIQGIDAGVVSDVEIPSTPGEPVVLNLKIDKKFQRLVRSDAVAEMAMQGILGRRVIEIQPGSAGAEPISDGTTIATAQPIELGQVLADAVNAGQELRQLGEQTRTILARVDDITARVQRGEGSLGQFVMSDAAHDSTVELMQSGDQLMTAIDETVTAARRSWLVRNYFINQGMGDPDEILYRPGSERASTTFPAETLFPAGSSVLTEAGKTRLTTLADKLKPELADSAEIVVAAFHQTEENSNRAQRLTQERATAVRDFLVNETNVARYGYFGRRTVTAAGFGNAQPDDQPSSAPQERVEVVVFTPKG